ncbi:MAG: glutathione S-transferase family protein [Burkholderiaceae bacterium]
MSEITLHHYELSPFSEKVRTAFGYKGLSWRSADVAPVPPRPLLSALTGGYRRIPVMQIGADVYCDTNVILAALDRLYPEPSLYPPGSEGVARGVGFAWERQMWIPTIGVLVHFIGEHLPPEFIKDRKEGYLGIDISKEAMAPQLPVHLQFVRAQLDWLKQALSQRPYLFGDKLSAADLACWQTIFLLRKNCPPEVDALLGLASLTAWYDKIASIGHGTHTPISSEDALAQAKSATPLPVTHIEANADPDGVQSGQTVVVTPDDNARVPVEGTLVAADSSEIIVRCTNPEAGDIHIHFPRLGFTIAAS